MVHSIFYRYVGLLAVMCYDVVDVLCVSCPSAIEYSAILLYFLLDKAHTYIDHWKVLDKLWCQISFKSDKR